MTIKLDDKEQRAADQSALDKVADDLAAERKAAQDKLFDAIIAIIPKDMTLVEANGVFIKLFVVGVLQVFPREKKEAMNAIRRVADILPKALEAEWGSKGHQGLLQSRSKEVNGCLRIGLPMRRFIGSSETTCRDRR